MYFLNRSVWFYAFPIIKMISSWVNHTLIQGMMHSGGQWLLLLLMLLGSVYAAAFGMSSPRFRCKLLHVSHVALDKR